MERLAKHYGTRTERNRRLQNDYKPTSVDDYQNQRPRGRLVTPDSSLVSLDELADLSFYDLPTPMFHEHTRLGNTLDLSELVSSPQRVSRPPHHAIAEARHIYTVMDSADLARFSQTPASLTIQDNNTHPEPSTHTNYHRKTQGNSRSVVSGHPHTDKRVAFSHAKMPNGTQTSLVGSESLFVASAGKNDTNNVSSRRGGDSRNRSVQRLNGQQHESLNRNQRPETQEKSLIGIPVVPSNLFRGSSASNRQYYGPSIDELPQHGIIRPPSQPSLTLRSNGFLSPRNRQNGTVGRSMNDKKLNYEQSVKEPSKSVSFQDLRQNSVHNRMETRNRENFQMIGDLSYINGSLTPRQRQSNLSHSGKRLEELLQHSKSQERDSTNLQPMVGSYGSSVESSTTRNSQNVKHSNPKLPLSPPTRDTDGLFAAKSATSDHRSAVQVLSLYDGKAVFQEHATPQSGFSRTRVWQSNTQVELPSSDLKPSNDSRTSWKSSTNRTVVPQTVTQEPSDQVTVISRNKTVKDRSSRYSEVVASKKSKEKEHSLDDTFESDSWRHLSLANSFSVDTSQRISSALWAMKLMEAAHSSNPGTYQNLLLKARLFRLWLQRARLKRVKKEEEQGKMESAITYWQTEVLHKYFVAWRNSQQAMVLSSQNLYKRHMLQKGLKGLKFAVQQQNLISGDLQARVKGRLLARYWLKWLKALQKKKTERLKCAFGRWKSNQLKESREKMLESMADRHVMSRNYAKWKMRYQVEQRNGVARLHFKIGLLTKSWHCWRVYAAEWIVKKRLRDVARVQYDEHLTMRMFTTWRENTGKSILAGNVARRRLAVKAFYRWKNWAQYAKVIRLRFQSMCKEYHFKSLVKAAFNKWQIRLQNKRADRFCHQTKQRRIFKLWYLRYRRKVIHRHLCKALAKKSKKRKFFTKWRNYTKGKQEKRQLFVHSLNVLELKHHFVKWKDYTSMKSSLRIQLSSHFQMKDSQRTRKAMDKWLFAMKVVNFRKQVRWNWSRRCTRKACKSWKLLLRRKYLEQRLTESRPALELTVMKRTFKKWLVEKRRADEEKEKITHVASILERNTKLRVLQAWRVANQESQIIAPMVARRERKVIARVFDAWRLHIYRQNHIVDHLTRTRETLLDKFFCYWRNRAVLIQKERNAFESLRHSKISRHFKAWRGYVLNMRLDRLRKRARTLCLMQTYFGLWRSKIEAKQEAKDEQDASQARERLLVLWVFNYWCESARRLRDRLNEQEQQLVSQNKRLLLAQSFRHWLRLYRNEQRAREHAKFRRDEFLRKIIQAWRKDTRETLEKEVFNFTSSLTLDSSMGSMLGSTFRSTLGSSYHSDALSTSGYGTDLRPRRGSGPVPLQYLRIDDRDDEVISLPGRFDQLRSTSVRHAPITVLREASSGQISPQSVIPEVVPGHISPQSVSASIYHPMSPAIVEPTSPSPSSSPEHMLPSFYYTVPLKSEDETVPTSGVHSGSDESEEQDDRMSVVSSFSITGRSIESVRDREMVLTDTILHWRLLPLSLTFRTWMKFTRQRKLMRELLFYLREKKRKEVLAHSLRKWRRELYVKFTAREHWLDKTRRKCLMAWYDYVQQSRIKEERKFMADEQRRMSCLERFLKRWRDRYTAKKRLLNFVIHWKKEALVTKQHKEKTEAVRHRRDMLLLKERFQYWLEHTRNSQDAKTFYYDKLLPKFFVAWRAFTREVAIRKQKQQMFFERRLLVMSFKEWRVRYRAAQKAGDLLEVKETSLLVEIVKSWHSWAQGMSSRRNQARNFRRSQEIETMKEIFAMWKGRSQKLQNSTRTYEHKLMRRVLTAWQDITVLGIQNRRKLQEFTDARTRNLVCRSFAFWRRLQTDTERARSNVQQTERRLVKKCFDEWRHDALKQRARKHNVHRLQRKMFLWWYDQHTKRKTARRLISNWRSKTKEAKFMNSKALEVVQETEKKLLRQSFDTWVLEAHKIQKAKHHARTKIMQSTFQAWSSYVHKRVEHRRLLEEVDTKKRQALLSNSFKTWSQLFQRRVRNLDLLESFLERKQTELLQSCTLRWRKDTLKCRAQKFHDRRLEQKSFAKWWFRLYTKKGLESVREKILRRKTRQAAKHWRKWTIRVKRQAEQAGDLHSRLKQRQLQDYFGRWVLATQRTQQAEKHHGRAVVKRSLKSWRTAVRTRVEERRKMQEFQERLSTKMVTKMFRKWRCALQTATRQQQLVSGQLALRNSRMLKRSMERWQKFVRKCKAEKHSNMVRVARCFLEWKIKTEDKLKEKEREQQLQEKADRYYRLKLSKLCFRGWLYDIRADQYERVRLNRLVERAFNTWNKKCSLNTIAKDLVDRRLFDKYWSMWRRQLIRKRVSELMQKHEEKKLLSEVFVAWFRLVIVRRQLLRAYKTHVTKKWFMKWMQKYNES